MSKYRKFFLKIFPLAVLIIFVLLEFFSRGAATIFNDVMAEQKILNGTVTVEKISANIFGEVTFENFLWKDITGRTLLEIPEGNFKVKIFDVITKNFKTTTLEEIYLTDANISLHLTEDMQVDFVGNSQELKKINSKKKSWENKTEQELKEIGERRRKFNQEKIEKGWKNFNIEGRKINLNLKLENCRLEVFYLARHYLFSRVNFETKINTDDKMILNVHTGIFGGTMIGRGFEMHGTVDFKPVVPQCNLTVLFQEVDPSSLGFGLNIHDEMTLWADFEGDISRPTGFGKLNMKKLDIPGLSFKNLEGKIYYKDATLKFTDVTAEVYDGKLSAHGDYNIDTRYYNIYGEGKNLKSYTALPNSHLHCDVDLKISLSSKGSAKQTFTSGSFVSNKGRYSIFKIKSISGNFKSGPDSIDFYDVKIDLGSLKVVTDALSIKDKKLNLSPIEILDKDGNIFETFTRD